MVCKSLGRIPDFLWAAPGVLREPELTGDTSWGVSQSQEWGDPHCLVLLEKKRRKKEKREVGGTKMMCWEQPKSDILGLNLSSGTEGFSGSVGLRTPLPNPHGSTA